jgi:hypothetical protein
MPCELSRPAGTAASCCYRDIAAHRTQAAQTRRLEQHFYDNRARWRFHAMSATPAASSPAPTMGPGAPTKVGSINGPGAVEPPPLISYGPDLVDLFRQAAGYVDRILRGEKPADLPVQAPTKYELLLNLKTAKAMSLDVPLVLQQRADEVIE